MPQTLERAPRQLRRIVPSHGRALPRIVAYNENHDELGQFAESDGGGSTREDALKHLGASAHKADTKAAQLTQKADKNPTTKNRLQAQQAHMSAIGKAVMRGDQKIASIHIAFLQEKTTENDNRPWKVGADRIARQK